MKTMNEHDRNCARGLRGLRVALVFAMLAGLFLGCAEEVTEVEELLPSVSVYVLEPRTLSEEIRASGDLEARFHTEIAAEVAAALGLAH